MKLKQPHLIFESSEVVSYPSILVALLNRTISRDEKKLSY